jgi:hypothetical protein
MDCYLITHPTGKLTVFQVSLPGGSPAKMMFEQSRDTDMTTHFDPEIHTLAEIERGIPGHIPLACREYDAVGLPTSRYFRETWVDTGTTVEVNMPHARLVQMKVIRQVRDAELRKLSGSEFRLPAAIEALLPVDERDALQVLRDIPATFDLEVLITPEDLEVAWPSELPARE